MPRPPASSSLLSSLAIALVGLSSNGVRAQITSNATCLSNWRDLYNSRGQSPCLVGAYIGGACNGGQYDVGALLEGEHYIGPTSLAANGCLCSTVMYSLMGACSTCQNATIITWSSWSVSCPEVFVQAYPQDIPQDTAVPGWAYDPIPNNGTFDVNQALADNSLESTATFVQSTNTGTRTTTGTASSIAQAGGEDDGGGSNTGAIAGGVVGGVVGVALLGLLGFFLYRRKRNQNAKLSSIQNSGVNANMTGSTYAGGAPGGPQGMGEYAPVPYTPHAYEGGGGAGGMASPPMMGQKLYDPNDPSTFPTAASPPPVSMTNQTTGSNANLSYAPSFPQPQTSNQGTYRGVAEV
ncbi:hypothetical protein ACEPAI_4592 [Sanghuangporus weigelae]